MSRTLIDTFTAAKWAAKNPLKHSSYRDERAMRFQEWYDHSVFGERLVVPPVAWREYERSMRCVQIVRR